jgi:phosphoribosylaminoimidazolecarboxamide formyltransferase/IMP cyclohydrolase
MNAWQLVKELRIATNLPAAASFKHCSPAGCAVGVPLTPKLAEVYHVEGQTLSHSAVAYLRARQADPKSSFGDFAALSDVVDEQTALFIKTEVSDGIIAPGYEEKALAILKEKKKGAFIVLKADPDYQPPATEFREVYGVCFAQRRNDTQITRAHLTNIVTRDNQLSEGAIRDLLVATIGIKYTQSNSVAYALDGQLLGVGAGQQSRVDCVKLAGAKVETWYLRQHPKVLGLKFKANTKKVDRVNARIEYIENDWTEHSRAEWESHFEEIPEELTQAEKTEFLKTLEGVSLASDAFFPFPDNIDQASKRGVSYIAQAGGSDRDKLVTAQADKYGMVMAFTGLRLFHH